ncbi:hypothetical protein MAPG_07547 [Magnaporthiopsis poae ATCC 64411]|uniref:Clock-controlled protein 6 n=1 Tax=Magnaporthiopsis poae (strain ATCC 64411 / 73-15) TaxID=644358 RepID=A0A0C4E4Z0_MAGP6|nr:hypothetical protein MAPG_07547 [Magnaporthiopsis poae ATCC 64411]
MKFSVAAVAVAAVSGVSAGFSNYTTGVTYTTEVVTAVTTYCPVATEITHGGKTYTVTSATTLTITDCPCTISKPVTTSKIVECKTCNQTAPVNPPPVKPTGPAPPAGTGSFTPTKPPASVPTAGAGKAAALSGAAAIAAVAAFVL